MKLLISALLMSVGVQAFAKMPDEITVVETAPELEMRFKEFHKKFKQAGTAQVAEILAGDSLDPEMLSLWQEFVKSGKARVIEVKVHPSRQKAVDEMNLRFKRMGVPNLQINAEYDDREPDPTALEPKKMKAWKWIRYLSGPGVAAASFFLGLPAEKMNSSFTEFLYLIIPAAGVGVTTVALELQFSWPWMNQNFWTPVWKLGGAVGGRISNIVVNFLYGMSLWGAGVGAAQIPTWFGMPAVPFETMTFMNAVTTSAVGGVIFHLVMGQYQTDISLAVDRGQMSGVGRYARETVGSVVNNGVRVMSWVVPAAGEMGLLAQAGFFLTKTFPQLLATHLNGFRDRQVARRINPDQTKPGVAEKCMNLLSQVPLINLPHNRLDD